MDEKKLPSLHIRRTKKNRTTAKDDGLPSLTIQRKREPSYKELEQRKKHMNIPCPHCGKVNQVVYYAGMDVLTELRSSYCSSCNKELYSLDKGSSEEWDEEEDDTELEDARLVVSSKKQSLATASGSGQQGQERYQPPAGKYRLGKDIQTGDYIDAPQAGRREGLYIIGTPGTGKTGLIENLIIQDIKHGMGVGLLDPHGDLINAVLARMDRRVDDVILLDIGDEDYPFGLNLFECSNPKSAKAVQFTVDQVMHVFDKLFGLSAATTPRLRQYLRNCTQTLIVNPGYTMADIPLLLLDEHCRKKLIANVISPQVQGFWKTYNSMKPSEKLDHADSTLNKLDELLQPLTLNIVGQSTSTIDLGTIMDEGKILLVKLSAQLDSVTSLIGSVLIALLLNAAYARPENKRRQFNLYADEFQRFATEDFATLLTEARKFGLATTIAHQARHQPGMTDGIRATSLSAKNLVMFKVNSQDGDELAGEFDITPQEAWEEEIQGQREKRIEEEVIDGEESIKAISQRPFDELLATHSNHNMRDIARTVLTPIDMAIKQVAFTTEIQEGTKDADKPLHYKVYVTKRVRFPDVCKGSTSSSWEYMVPLDKNYKYYVFTTETELLRGKELINRLFIDVMEGKFASAEIFSESIVTRIVEIVNTLRGFLGLQPTLHWVIEYDDTHTQVGSGAQAKMPMVRKPRSWSTCEWQPYELDRESLEELETFVSKTVMLLAAALMRQESPAEEEFTISRGRLTLFRHYFHVKEIQEYFYSYYPQKYLDSPDGKNHWRKIYEEIYKTIHAEKEVETVEEFIRALYLLCAGFTVPENHILVPTGQTIPRKRTQIHYITQPRQTIMHPQRTYADMLKQVASELVNQDNYLARVRYIDANQRCVECTIRTLNPKQDTDKAVFGQALQARISHIKEKNMQHGYVRERATVEAEIRQRQEQCSMPPEEEPPISRRPQH